VASATRDGRTLIAVVLGASSENARTHSAIALLDWAFAFAQPA
jgi:D-alanyl-D-alanine carboxypeptidase